MNPELRRFSDTDRSCKYSLVLYNAVTGAAFGERWVEELLANRHAVSVVSATDEGSYRRAKSRIARLWLQLRLLIGFPLKVAGGLCLARLRREGLTVRIVTTNPFFAPALLAALAPPADTTVCLLYDLYPDALLNAGALRPGGWLALRIAGVTRFMLRRCDATVFMGERLRHHAEVTYGAARQTAVIPVGGDGRAFRRAGLGRLSMGDRVTILYAGLLGRMHDATTIAEVLRGEPVPGLHFRFQASGVAFIELQQCVPAAWATFGGPLGE